MSDWTKDIDPAAYGQSNRRWGGMIVNPAVFVPTALISLFMAHGSEIAAVIVEPVPANAGLYLPREGFPPSTGLGTRLCAACARP